MSSKRYIIGQKGGSNGTINDFIKILFQTQLVNKLVHWKTKSFALHKATDQFDDVLGSLIDRFMEVYIGSYNASEVKEGIQIDKIDIGYINDDNIKSQLMMFKSALIDLRIILQLNENNSDLLNIRDEMLSEVNKMNYLLTLNGKS